MKGLLPRSVRARTTATAVLLTAAVLVVASLLIVRLVERDLEANAREALTNALESASHSVGGEESEGSESQGEEAERAAAESSDSSGNDAAQQAIADSSVAEVQAGVDAASRALLLIVPAVVVLLAVAIWITVGRALRPVQAISTRVEEISGSTLHGRVPEPDSGDEIAELARLVNQMLDRLEDASDRQKAFVADASHELRSPLSTIVAAADVASISADPMKLKKLSGTVSSEAARMQELIADLLDLARLDEQRDTLVAEEIDLRSVCGRAADRADPGDRSISVEGAQDVMVDGIESQLERAVFNLVDNAVAHAAARVRIEIAATAAGALVTVEDDGPGIPAEDRARVFDRFVRLDESRERNTGGTGIGLSLVKAIAERHSGSVEVDQSPTLGGARFMMHIENGAAATPYKS